MVRKESTRGSNARGIEFEELVASLLETVRSRHEALVQVLRHPKIMLNSGNYDIADFELVCDFPHQRDRRIIECQDRDRSARDIVRKIRDMKSQSDRNRFILVYKEEGFLSDALLTALKADGISHYSVEAFAGFLIQLSASLDAVQDEFGGIDFGHDKTILARSPLLKNVFPVLGPKLNIDSLDTFSEHMEERKEWKDEGMIGYEEPGKSRW